MSRGGATGTAVVVVPPVEKWGPAMKKLPTDSMRAFVVAMLEFGGNDHTRAARAAGYASDNDNALRVTAHRLAHDPRIQEAIQEEARLRMKSGAIMAVNNLLQIADDPTHKDRLKANLALLDRIGFHAVSEHKVTVDHNDEEVVARAKRLMQNLGWSPEQMKATLGRYGVTDVEYTEVQPKPESDEGLEDIL